MPVPGQLVRERPRSRRGAHILRRYPGDRFSSLRTVLGPGDELRPRFEVFTALVYKGPIDQSFGDHHMRHGVDDRHIGARRKLQVVRCLDVRRANQIDPTRVDDDEFRPLAQPALHPGGEYRVRVGRVGADHHDHVRLGDRAEVLRSDRGAEGLVETVTRRRVAHPARRCRRCCSRTPRAPSSARHRPLHWCTGTR